MPVEARILDRNFTCLKFNRYPRRSPDKNKTDVEKEVSHDVILIIL